MSGSFSALMAYSHMKTQESERAVQVALAERKRKEALRRKQQEEFEQKQRELEAQLRLRHFEDEKKEKERQARRERELEAKRLEAQRREEEQRQTLLHGPKKAKAGGPRYPTSNSSARDDLRRRRFPSDDEDSASTALTREEKRERRLANEYRFGPTRRPSSAAGYGKAGKRLPGGAIDVATPPPSSTPPDVAAGSVRARLSAMPNTLTKLNVVKRDTRTIDEILRDRAKAREVKTLDGDEAKEFHDWFGAKPKADKDAASAKKARSSRSASVSDSRSTTPAAFPKPSAPSPKKAPPPKPARPSSSKAPASSSKAQPASLSSIRMPKVTAPVKSSAQKVPPSSKSVPTSSKPTLKKRPRSPSLSDSEFSDSDSPPRRRRQKSAIPDISAEIWSLFGKNRDAYVSRNVESDDEDMEVDVRDLEKEELKSARLAKREDLAAEEEERRREEEKRKRKKERERWE
ncbi:hypothetical protein BV25DRAFT_1860900 [Artomyces pyxidatus]|uniref:Uncharacterized protein n=1 Tax=Artomyces pyxidatus TaxID=48021 RepID=A0ACB8SSS0_9AGAM|nr:hypothetical protein BV25DRAFT_1860900 [Artomyces pyxidatus]